MTRGPMLGMLLLISVLLTVLELMFQGFYIGPVPLPLGSLAILASMPWLVRATTEVLPSTAGAAAPVLVWFLVTAVVGAFGPGGDMLLPGTWQTMLLLLTGVVVGLVCFRRAVDRLAQQESADRAPERRNHDPRVRKARS